MVATSTLVVSVPAAAGEDARRRGTPDTYVAAWDDVGTRAMSAGQVSPGDSHTIFAYLSIAVYDAVMAIKGGYEPFAVDTEAPDGASAEAAVAAAAHRVLNHYLPGQAAAITDPAYATSLEGIPDGEARSNGVATGEAVADRLIATRADDGFRATVPPYVPPDPPIAGAWLPTAPTPPIGTYFPFMRPFALRAADQFRPDGPPALNTKQWAREFNEVKAIGSSSSTTRTPAQTVAAQFWAEAPIAQGHGALRGFVLGRRLDIVDAARFMAMVGVSAADANIACFEAKYHYAFWRPITAIRAGDTDGNSGTAGDPAWTPLLPVTPNHPDYPSAHSCITPVVGRVIARFLGTQHIDFTIPSLTGLGDRHYATPEDLTTEVSDARVWGGIHFRSAVKEGAQLAKQVSRWVLDRHFERDH
jgi:hypothetical protein